MANVKLFDQTGKEVSTVELNDAIFGIEPNESVVFDVVISQRASLRQGTHAVKNRSAVSGGGRKPWRQKGTGRARQGSIRSPQWRGGGSSACPLCSPPAAEAFGTCQNVPAASGASGAYTPFSSPW